MKSSSSPLTKFFSIHEMKVKMFLGRIELKLEWFTSFLCAFLPLGYHDLVKTKVIIRREARESERRRKSRGFHLRLSICSVRKLISCNNCTFQNLINLAYPCQSIFMHNAWKTALAVGSVPGVGFQKEIEESKV